MPGIASEHALKGTLRLGESVGAIKGRAEVELQIEIVRPARRGSAEHRDRP